MSIGKFISKNFGALVGGATGILSSVLGGSSSSKQARYDAEAQRQANETNILLTRETNAANAQLAANANALNYSMFREGVADQERAAQNALRWRVKDAEAAGIHPLYAMGNPGISTNPMFVGATASQNMAPQVSPVSRVASKGSNISRALAAGVSGYERAVAAKAAAAELKEAQIDRKLNREHAALQNDLLRSEIARINSAQVGPGSPVVSNDSVRPTARGAVDVVPASRITGEKFKPWQEPGLSPDIQYTRTKTGWKPRMSDQTKKLTEDQIISTVEWELGNNILPRLLGNSPPPPPSVSVPKGYHLRYDRFAGEYRLARNDKRNVGIRRFFRK